MRTRRSLLGATANAAAAGAVFPMAARLSWPSGATQHPDAELIGACAEFCALEEQYIAVSLRADRGGLNYMAEGRLDHVTAMQDAVTRRIVAIQAATPQGIAARARCLALWAPEMLAADQQDTAALLIGAIIRDLLSGRPA